MPEYLSILREASVYSIYVLFILVLLLFFIKGRIKEKEFIILFYIWLPIAVITQFFMTYYRLSTGSSNLHIMNMYLMFELAILTTVLLIVRKKVKNVEINVRLWIVIILAGIAIHFIYEFDSMHGAALLFLSIVYFQLTTNFIDLNKIDNILSDPYSLLNITIFVKAFGYSYLLIYQTDYTFPLSIFSVVNLMVQFLFAVTLFTVYRQKRNKEYP